MEVFSRRSRAVTAEEGSIRPLAVVTPSRLQDFFAVRLNEICTRFEEWALPFQVMGRLGSVPADTWRRYDPLPLHDLHGEGEIGLELSLALLEKSGVQAGDLVQVTGFMRARLVRGQVVLRFEVLALTHHRLVEDAQNPAESGDAALLEVLRAHPPKQHPFPVRADMRLLLVGLDMTAERIALFKEALGGGWQNRAFRTLSFSTGSQVSGSLTAEDYTTLRQALLHGRDDIVVLLADERACSALDHPIVLQALAACPVHRLLVQDRDDGEMADHRGIVTAYMVDRSFISLQEAGRYLRRESGRFLQEAEEERARQEELNALRGSLARFAGMPDPVPVPTSSGVLRSSGVGMVVGAMLVGAVAVLLWWL